MKILRCKWDVIDFFSCSVHCFVLPFCCYYFSRLRERENEKSVNLKLLQLFCARTQLSLHAIKIKICCLFFFFMTFIIILAINCFWAALFFSRSFLFRSYLSLFLLLSVWSGLLYNHYKFDWNRSLCVMFRVFFFASSSLFQYTLCVNATKADWLNEDSES